CLFWSRPASESQWVEKEWRCAYQARGLDYIHPVSLVDPRAVPPPKELASRHFEDLTRIVYEYERLWNWGNRWRRLWRRLTNARVLWLLAWVLIACAILWLVLQQL